MVDPGYPSRRAGSGWGTRSLGQLQILAAEAFGSIAISQAAVWARARSQLQCNLNRPCGLGWHSRRIIEKSGRGQPQRVAKTTTVAPLAGDPVEGVVVKMKVARRRSRDNVWVANVSFALSERREIDGHRGSKSLGAKRRRRHDPGAVDVLALQEPGSVSPVTRSSASPAIAIASRKASKESSASMSVGRRSRTSAR